MTGRTLAILMWKHLMVRMRRFIHTPVEFLSPILFIALLFAFKNNFNPETSDRLSNNVRNTDVIPFDRLGVPTHVYYTPDNNFTSALMREAGALLGLKYNAKKDFKKKPAFYAPFSDWSEMSEKLDDFGNDDAIVEIHGQSEDPNKLSYTVRMSSRYYTNTFRSDDDTNAETHSNYGSDFKKFVSLQWALDTSFIKLTSNKTVTQESSCG